MSLETGIHKLVYEYYEARILYGFYAYGEELPSISKICAIFHMAPATVRAALAVLEKKGYIQIDARKASKVIYKPDCRQRKKSAAEYFVPREKEIRDILVSQEFLFEPCRKQGMSRWGSEEWEKFKAVLDRAPSETMPIPVQFYLSALNTLDNSLVLNLYWEVVRFNRLPYLADNEGWKGVWKELGEKSGDEIISAVKHHVESTMERSAQELFGFIREARKEFAVEQTEPVLFYWNIYRQRPQLCYMLICSIIRDIGKEVYPVGSFLPSLPQMAKYYNVSVSTVRRSLSILNSMGITRSFQGKGTQIQMDIRNIDFKRQEIQDGLKLYVEVLQLLKLTVKKILLFTLTAATEDARFLFMQEFFRRLDDQSYLCIETCITFIKEKCPLSTVRECYGKVQELIVWGYPFTLYRLKDKKLHTEYSGRMQNAAGHLKKEDFAAFADCFEDLYRQEERKVRDTFDI